MSLFSDFFVTFFTFICKAATDRSTQRSKRQYQTLPAILSYVGVNNSVKNFAIVNSFRSCISIIPWLVHHTTLVNALKNCIKIFIEILKNTKSGKLHFCQLIAKFSGKKYKRKGKTLQNIVGMPKALISLWHLYDYWCTYILLTWTLDYR